jgi:CBS-domain-containing membrane protein
MPPSVDRSDAPALVVVVHGVPWSFLLTPVTVGALLLAAFAFAWHNLAGRGAWPERWW